MMFKSPNAFLLLALLVLSQLIFEDQPVALGDNDLVKIGQRIYREGLLPSGEPLRAEMQGDLSFSGAQAACVTCHRRSGLGSIEGGRSVLPVTGSALYQPGPAGLWQKFAFKTQGNDFFRPAYSDSSLSKAIREGVTPTGRVLRAPMPRFNLSEADMQALIAYLKTLSSSPAPGVDDTTLHLATVITPDADAGERKAMLDVIDAYIKEKNTETRSETRRRQTSKEVMYTSYRKLDLSIWELQGQPETWEAQLQQKYRQQPVFALVSGLSGSHWQPVHSFCEHSEVACLFPNTAVPVIQAGDFFSVYFSKGPALEAEVLAKYLQAQAPSGPILQVFRDEPKGSAAAAQFRQAFGQTAVKDYKLGNAEKSDAAFWAQLLKAEQPATLVLWLANDDLAGIDTAALASSTIYLSASLLGEQMPPALQGLREQLRVLASWDTAEAREPRVARTRLWLQTRQVAFTHEVLQTNTFWALLSTTDAIKHLAGNFSPAYLVERLEDMTESLGVTSIYPRLSLGPGQRFAAKSARVLKFNAQGRLEAVSDWINP